MRGLMPSCHAKALTIEDGLEPEEMRADRFNVFRWFIMANVVLLIIFCSYALWSLYQLDNAMKSREEAISLQKYFGDRQDDEQIKEALDFEQWKKSIVENLQGDGKSNGTYGNLKLLLQSIGLAVENKKSQVIVANLTEQEVEVIKEFSKLRYPRTIRGSEDESQCNLQFSVTVTNNDEPLELLVKPASKGKGMVNIKSTTNYMKKDEVQSDLRECSFNIVYQPQNRDENAI